MKACTVKDGSKQGLSQGVFGALQYITSLK